MKLKCAFSSFPTRGEFVSSLTWLIFRGECRLSTRKWPDQATSVRATLRNKINQRHENLSGHGVYTMLLKQGDERLSVGNKKWQKIKLEMRQYYPEMGCHAGCYEWRENILLILRMKHWNQNTFFVYLFHFSSLYFIFHVNSVNSSAPRFAVTSLSRIESTSHPDLFSNIYRKCTSFNVNCTWGE